MKTAAPGVSNLSLHLAVFIVLFPWSQLFCLSFSKLVVARVSVSFVLPGPL